MHCRMWFERHVNIRWPWRFHNTTPTSAYKYGEHDRQCTYKPNREARSRNHCCDGKARSITYSEGLFVVFVIQHAKRTPHIILTSVPCLALPYFSRLTHRRQDFRRRELLLTQNTCLDFLYNFCLKHFLRYEEFIEISYMCLGIYVIRPLFTQFVPYLRNSSLTYSIRPLFTQFVPYLGNSSLIYVIRPLFTQFVPCSSDVNKTWISPTGFREILKYHISRKSV
jgi:hypothetical protein